MRLILKPDWDPNNPYHYHVNGQKVVVTPEDWEKYKNDPTFREVRAAVEAEQAAYPEPEYDEVPNPAWRKAYQNLVNGVNLKGRDNYNLPLPQGYTRDEKGVAMDVQGNYYIPVETATNAPYFVNQERGTMGHTVPVRYEQQQMPDRTIRQLRQPLPVDRVMDVDNIRKASIDSYIENHTTPKKKIHYINSAFVSYLYPELATKSSDKTEYNRAVKSAKKLGFKVLDNYTPEQFNSFLIGFNDIDFEKWKKEMYDRFGDGENDVYFDNTTLNETINSGKTWRDGPNGSMGYQVRYEGGSPSHQEAEKKAVIKVGDLEKLGTFAEGGNIDDPPKNGYKPYPMRNTPYTTPFSRVLLPSVTYTGGNEEDFTAVSEDVKRTASITTPKRVRQNDSPTKDYTTELEDSTAKHFSNVTYDVINPTRYRIVEHGPQIPYIENKEILIDGNRTSSNVLDSIYKYSTQANLPFVDALGLAAQETRFGALPKGNYTKPTGEEQYDEWVAYSNRSLANSNYFRNYGNIPSYALVRDWDWLNNTDRSEPPLLHAFKKYKSGDYNRGDKNHTRDVHTAGLRAIQSPAVKKWMEENGIYKKGGKLIKCLNGEKIYYNQLNTFIPKIINPKYNDFVRQADLLTYQSNLQNYRELGNYLPEGYKFRNSGLIQGPNGELYALKGYQGSLNYNNPFTITFYKGKPILKDVLFYPINDVPKYMIEDDSKKYYRPIYLYFYGVNPNKESDNYYTAWFMTPKGKLIRRMNSGLPELVIFSDVNNRTSQAYKDEGYFRALTEDEMRSIYNNLKNYNKGFFSLYLLQEFPTVNDYLNYGLIKKKEDEEIN